MKIIIAGSRHAPYSCMDQIPEALSIAGFTITEEVCGMARGIDTWGAKWASLNNIPVKKFPAEWDKYGKSAGLIRNNEMAEYADGLLVWIWNGSIGSTHMLKAMQRLKKPYLAIFDGILST